MPHSKQLNMRVSKWLGLFIVLIVVFLCSCHITNTNPGSSIRHIVPEGYQSEWIIQVKRGNTAAKRKQWQMAALLYNKALDLMDNPRMTPQAPLPNQIEKVIRLASHAQILAGNSGTRSLQNCSTMMRSAVRGIKITKHLVPVEFKFNKIIFTEKGKSSAQQFADCLIKKQNGRGFSKVTLVGHTDEKGSYPYNDKLSIKRAEALKKYLRREGVTLYISIQGRGEREPLRNIPSSLSQAEIDQLNRRVEVRTD